MTSITQKGSKLFLGAAIRVVTLALFLVVFGASAALAQTRAYVANSGSNTVSVINTVTNAVTAPDDQVPFTVIGTAGIREGRSWMRTALTGSLDERGLIYET